MRTRKMTRVVRLAASTVLAAAISPALAQDAPKQADGADKESPSAKQGRGVTPGGFRTTLSIFSQDSPKPPAPASEAASNQPEALPAPRAAAATTTTPRQSATNSAPENATATCLAPPLPWWKRCKVDFWAGLGYEAEFEPVPFGASVRATYRNHVANGDAARMVLYHYDFVDGAAVLNARGLDRLANIAAMLEHNGFPIIVERTPSNPALAGARRLAILNQLGRGGAAFPPERVVVGAPIANGLRGGEAEIIYQNLLTQTRERGLVTGAASGFVGAATAPPSAGGGAGGGAGAPPPSR